MMLTQTQDLTQEDERDKINTLHTHAHTLQQREREREQYINHNKLLRKPR
jgi:hypothetical protein